MKPEEIIARAICVFDESGRADRVQGFVNHPKTTQYWVRDFALPLSQDVIWEGSTSEEMMAALRLAKARLKAQAALAALRAAGFVVVPAEPTEGMLEAGMPLAGNCYRHELSNAYAAMLAAADEAAR